MMLHRTLRALFAVCTSRMSGLRISTKSEQKHLSPKIKSIPIFITAKDKLKVLKQSIQSLTEITSPYHIVILDVGTTFKPTKRYFEYLKQEGVEVLHSNHTDGAWTHFIQPMIEGYMKKNPHYDYFVLTDSDVELDNVHPDILNTYAYLLQKLGTGKVGCALRIDDIPDYYPLKYQGGYGGAGMLKWEEQFWMKKNMVERDDDDQPLIVYDAPIDTTFALYHRNTSIPAANWWQIKAVRVGAPYSCRHLDWYIDPAYCSEDQIYYEKHTNRTVTSGTHWSTVCKNHK